MSDSATLYAALGDIAYIDASLDIVDVNFDNSDFSFATEIHKLPVRDMRALTPGPTLEREGFTFAHLPSDVVRNRREELVRENSAPREIMADVTRDYLAELLPLIRQLAPGAREVFAQYDTITVRFSSASREQGWMGTSAFAHFDFEASDVDRLLRDTLELTGREIAPFSRQVLVQTWRGITEAPQDEPLILCDGRTVSEDDCIPMIFHGPEGSRNELVKSRAGRFRATHQWYYLSDMTPDEILIFKGFDSASPEAGNAMHTAFRDKSLANPIPRGSIECRFIALYD